MVPVIEQTLAVKPEIIGYYNQTKGGVDRMNEMVSQYIVKQRTSWWPFAFFYNIMDVAPLATYIIHVEHNPWLKSTEDHHLFLIDLAFQLCKSQIEACSQNPNIVGKPFGKHLIEMCLGH